MLNEEDSVCYRYLESAGESQTLAETHDRILLVADPLVKLNHFGVRRAHLQVDLRTPQCSQPCFRLFHQEATNAAAAPVRRDAEVIDPAAMAVVADHHGADDCA